jgi:hypothetical protein
MPKTKAPLWTTAPWGVLAPMFYPIDETSIAP